MSGYEAWKSESKAYRAYEEASQRCASLFTALASAQQIHEIEELAWRKADTIGPVESMSGKGMTADQAEALLSMLRTAKPALRPTIPGHRVYMVPGLHPYTNLSIGEATEMVREYVEANPRSEMIIVNDKGDTVAWKRGKSLAKRYGYNAC